MVLDLPETLTFDFLDEQEWRPGPLEHFELCELGFARRPKDLTSKKGIMQPGTLYAPEPRGRRVTLYRLHIIGNKKPIYLSPQEAMESTFGRFLDRRLLDVNYVRLMRSLALEFNARHFRREKRLAYQDTECEGMLPMRRCATCGKKTRSYRCDACWTKIRAQATSCDEPATEYRLGRH